MDYEELYLQMQTLEKDFKDKLQTAQKALKSMCANSEKGELKSISKDLSIMESVAEAYAGLVDKYSKLTAEFDGTEYMESGAFAKQMIEFCEKLSVDINGEYPVYEMFPHKVKIDSANQELYIDRKKVQCMRPQYFVKLIRKSQDKLNKAAFNMSGFLNELSSAYDTALIYKEHNGRSGNSEPDIYLKDLYNYMVPMQRFRREYDMQSYAFDLARLYAEPEGLTKDGRSFEMGTTRKAAKLIRILDSNGKEQFLGTIRFFTRYTPVKGEPVAEQQ